MAISSSFLKLPGTNSLSTNPLPYFRDKRKHHSPGYDKTLSKEDLDHFGYEAAFRVLPYKILDRYDHHPHNLQIATLVMENEFLRAEFLPGYGGRLYSLLNKQTKKELLYKTAAIKPANLSARNASFPGGISWNDLSTFENVFFARVETDSGYEFLRMYDYERMRGIIWQIDFHLPDNSRELYAHVVIRNVHKYPVPLTWWTTMDLPEEEGCRIFSGTKDVLYPVSGSKNFSATPSFARGALPDIKALAPEDASYPLNFSRAGAYFLQNSETDEAPWGAITYSDGNGFLERSTQPLKTRGMRCFGTNAAGNNWRRRLTSANTNGYVTLQAGLTKTSLHGMDIGGNSVISFTQAFGALKLDAADTTDTSYDLSQAIVKAVSNTVIPAAKLNELHQAFSSHDTIPCTKILYSGSGWGALENMRRILEDLPPLPQYLFFPAESFTEEQYDWLALLSREPLRELEGDQIPASWMTDINYLPYLKAYLEDHPDSVTARVLAGVLLYENDFSKDAVKLWKEAMAIRPLPIILRNLAFSANSAGFTLEALTYMERINWNAYPKIDIAFWDEYFQLLLEDRQYRKMYSLYQNLPRVRREVESLRVLACEAALELKDYTFLEHAFKIDFITLGSDDSRMKDIWLSYAEIKGLKAADLPKNLNFCD